jgi:hypothetical protein
MVVLKVVMEVLVVASAEDVVIGQEFSQRFST